MKKFFLLLICIGVIGSLRGAAADIMAVEETQELFRETQPLTAVCFDEFGLTAEYIEEVKTHGKPEDVDPCFFRCAFIKMGVMDTDGMYDHSSAKNFVTKFVKDEGRLKTLISVMEICLKVNDEDVSVGKQGECERALLLFKCIMYVDWQRAEFI